ncbi:hypothetical protein ACLOJK_034908, partial [Asimina triloba]
LLLPSEYDEILFCLQQILHLQQSVASSSLIMVAAQKPNLVVNVQISIHLFQPITTVEIQRPLLHRQLCFPIPEHRPTKQPSSLDPVGGYLDPSSRQHLLSKSTTQ